jgi:hypothetical protein
VNHHRVDHLNLSIVHVLPAGKMVIFFASANLVEVGVGLRSDGVFRSGGSSLSRSSVNVDQAVASFLPVITLAGNSHC